MKLTKKLAVLFAALMISASMAACGGSAPAASASEVESEAASEAVSSEAPASKAASSEAASSEAASSEAAPAAPTGEKMTEDAYKAKVLELFNKAADSAKEIGTVDENDLDAVINGMQKVVDTTKVAYTEMANLNAPDSFADAQANLKTGVEASLKLMDLSLEMMTLATTDMTEEEGTKLMAEYQAKMAAVTPDTVKLNEGLVAVLGEDVVNAAAAAVNAG